MVEVMAWKRSVSTPWFATAEAMESVIPMLPDGAGIVLLTRDRKHAPNLPSSLHTILKAA